MSYPKLICCYLLAVAILIGAPPTFAKTDEPLQLDIPYELFELENGLTVLVHSDQSIPAVLVGMYYRVGSKDEPPGKSGFAHLFEHLMFQETTNRKGEYFELLQEAGAFGVNGTTSMDRTNYLEAIPPDALDRALWMESDRMIHMADSITQEMLDEQRGVVQNEKRQRELYAYSASFDILRKAVFPLGHPYHHSVIGTMEDLNAASLDDVREWFDTYYGASNAVLVIAGNVTLETAKSKAEKYFAAAPVGKPLIRHDSMFAPMRSNQMDIVYDEVGQAQVTRTWAIPGSASRDAAIANLVSLTLAGNKNAPLRRKLVDELGIATNVRSFTFPRMLGGMLIVSADVRLGADPDEVAAEMDLVVADFLADVPDESLLESVKQQLYQRTLAPLEDFGRVGLMLGQEYVTTGDPLFMNQRLEWWHEASAEDVRDTAVRWLDKPFNQIITLPFPEYEPSANQVDRSSIPDVGGDAKLTMPETETAMLDNGLKLVVINRGGVPIVNVRVAVAAGSLSAPDGLSLVPGQVAQMLDKGTKKLDAAAMAAKLYSLGMEPRIRTSGTRSMIDFGIVPSRLEEAMQVTSSMLREASFPEEELGKIRNKLKGGLANQMRSAHGQAQTVLNNALFGADAHIGYLMNSRDIESLSRDDLLAFHSSAYGPTATTIFIVGDVDIDEAAGYVESAFGDWQAGTATGSAGAGAALPARSRVILIDAPGAASSTVISGIGSAPFDVGTRAANTVMNQIIGGDFMSRLNMNLREDKAWSYGYRSRMLLEPHGGDQTFLTSGQVQADKTAESMLEIRNELEVFVTSGPATAGEVASTVTKITRSRPAAMSSNTRILGTIAQADVFGRPLDDAETFVDELSAVTVEDVRAAAKATIHPDRMTWVVVGDLAKIEDSVRALEFGDVEVWDVMGNVLR